MSSISQKKNTGSGGRVTRKEGEVSVYRSAHLEIFSVEPVFLVPEQAAEEAPSALRPTQPPAGPGLCCPSSVRPGLSSGRMETGKPQDSRSGSL